MLFAVRIFPRTAQDEDEDEQYLGGAGWGHNSPSAISPGSGGNNEGGEQQQNGSSPTADWADGRGGQGPAAGGGGGERSAPAPRGGADDERVPLHVSASDVLMRKTREMVLTVSTVVEETSTQAKDSSSGSSSGSFSSRGTSLAGVNSGRGDTVADEAAARAQGVPIDEPQGPPMAYCSGAAGGDDGDSRLLPLLSPPCLDSGQTVRAGDVEMGLSKQQQQPPGPSPPG